MPDLNFIFDTVEAETYSAVPQLIFKIRIRQTDGVLPIHTVALRCQIRIEPARRRYSEAEEHRLFELFGKREQWSQTLRSTLWTHAATMVPAFTANTVADLPVPCTFDFNVAMTKYFDALDDGEVPLTLLFSGTVFYQAENGALQAAPISWDKEGAAKLPIQVWRDMMQHYYPNSAWLSLNKDVFDRLQRFKMHSGQMTFDSAIEELLAAAEEKVPE